MTKPEMKARENQFCLQPVKLESEVINRVIWDGKNQYLGCWKKVCTCLDPNPQIPNLQICWIDLTRRKEFFISFHKHRLFTEAP